MPSSHVYKYPPDTISALFHISPLSCVVLTHITSFSHPLQMVAAGGKSFAANTKYFPY